ncbi:mucin-13-like [Onychostoma macrolepis]|nr:mucin-13-like [Onychostoma macrolepis]
MSGSVPSQGTTSQFAPGSPSPYDSLYCKCALSPQGVDRESTTVQSSHKQFTSRYGTESGSSTPFTLQGSIAYDRSPRPQGTASQLGPVSHSYPSVSSSSQGVASQSTTVQFSRKQLASTYTGSSGTQAGSSPPFTLQEALLMVDHLKMPQVHLPLGMNPLMEECHCPHPKLVHLLLFRVHGSSLHLPSQGALAPRLGPLLLHPAGSTAYGGSPQDAASPFAPGYESSYGRVSLSSPQAGPSTTVQGSRKQFTSTFTGGSGTQAGSSPPFTLQGSTAYGGSSQPQDAASQLVHGSYPYASVSLSSPQGAASQSSQSYQGASASQSRESQKWQPSATHLTPVIRTSDATASQGSSPMQFSSLSSAGGSSRVSGQFVSAHGGSTSYGGSFQSQSLSSKYTPGFQHLPYETSVAGQGTSSASEVLSSYSSMNNQNAPAQPSSSSRFYSVKG